MSEEQFSQHAPTVEEMIWRRAETVAASSASRSSAPRHRAAAGRVLEKIQAVLTKYDVLLSLTKV